MERKRIRLIKIAAILRLNAVFVQVVLFYARAEGLPDAAAAKIAAGVGALVPVVEVAHHADGGRLRGPYPENHALHPVVGGHMRAQQLAAVVIGALLEKIDGQLKLFVLAYVHQSSSFLLAGGLALASRSPPTRLPPTKSSIYNNTIFSHFFKCFSSEFVSTFR